MNGSQKILSSRIKGVNTIMSKIFESTEINGMCLNNRLVRSATWEGMCDPDGKPGQQLIDCYRDLASGGVGLIISGYSFVSHDGRQAPGMMGMYSDDFAAEMKDLANVVHDAGGKICVQLVHAGGQSAPTREGQGSPAPSAVEMPLFQIVPQEMSTAGITYVVKAFSEGAKRVKEYGFDGVQLHGAHGFLINQFLSSAINKRTDDYGGSIGNRCRFLMEVYQGVRDAVGDDFPVMIKLSGADFNEGGLVIEDAVYAAGKLSEAGIDAIEVSAGNGASGEMGPARSAINKPEQEAYNLDLTRKIKEAVNCPVMLVGGVRSLEVIEKAFTDDGMDYVSMSRPLIREPGLANRWESGDTSKAKCISCNGCFAPAMEGKGIYCVVEAKIREKSE